ncbi:hypothetical protein [Aquimarina algiphila]|uniref:hypothetical protein n=1 Tax=Aquimarina algiphila TaxID=2047982 RepID=UPI00232F1931|nr:hypothetical protein [Aquimarina algiphila]
MKKLVTVSAFVVFGLSISSCETTDVNDEIYESELQLVDPSNDGTIDEDDRREGE